MSDPLEASLVFHHDRDSEIGRKQFREVAAELDDRLDDISISERKHDSDGYQTVFDVDCREVNSFGFPDPVLPAVDDTVQISYYRESRDPLSSASQVRDAFTGRVTTVGKHSFEIETHLIDGKGVNRTVDLEDEEIRRLVYRAGGDEEWDRYELADWEVTDR